MVSLNCLHLLLKKKIFGSLLGRAESLVPTFELLVAACGMQVPDQGSNLGPTHWELGVLAPGPLGQSPFSPAACDGLSYRSVVTGSFHSFAVHL